MPILLRFLNGLGLGTLGILGCLGLLILVAAILAVSALFWGSILGLLVWNTLHVYQFFHSFGGSAGPLTFWQAMGVGLLASFVLG